MELSSGNEKQLYQNVIVMRHGPRLDNFDKSWTSGANSDRPWNPPLYDGDEFKNLYSETAKKIWEEVGAPIHRVIVSPFLRCLQTASRTIEALSSQELLSSSTTAGVVHFSPPQIKASVEYGLAEMMNKIAIWVPPQDGDFKFVISECETHLPPETLRHSTTQQVYEKLPEWEETQEVAWDRYNKVVRALADKYPRENLLLVTHAEGIMALASTFIEGGRARADYCGYVHLRRPVINFVLQGQSHITLRGN
ncbi:unnamed protein product [Cuscuta europaea]|uniref:Uncharacterized protein n=1 Tax=Cuscuta europaea TaxID=41803 RepID=A0A9P0ZEC4_CUSEU|nr:unnamed protein product [Cuscuta europaea]